MNMMITSPLMQSARNWLSREAPNLPSEVQIAIESLYSAVESGHVCIRVDAANAADWYATGWVIIAPLFLKTVADFIWRVITIMKKKWRSRFVSVPRKCSLHKTPMPYKSNYRPCFQRAIRPTASVWLFS